MTRATVGQFRTDISNINQLLICRLVFMKARLLIAAPSHGVAFVSSSTSIQNAVKSVKLTAPPNQRKLLF